MREKVSNLVVGTVSLRHLLYIEMETVHEQLDLRLQSSQGRAALQIQILKPSSYVWYYKPWFTKRLSVGKERRGPMFRGQVDEKEIVKGSGRKWL